MSYSPVRVLDSSVEPLSIFDGGKASNAVRMRCERRLQEPSEFRAPNVAIYPRLPTLSTKENLREDKERQDLHTRKLRVLETGLVLHTLGGWRDLIACPDSCISHCDARVEVAQIEAAFSWLLKTSYGGGTRTSSRGCFPSR